MDFPVIDPVYSVGVLVLAAVASAAILTALGASAVVLFVSKRRVILPGASLVVVSGLEMPVKRLLGVFGREPEQVDALIGHLRNMMSEDDFAKAPTNKRALFLPQCLRSPKCPARLSPEGIQCINCGQCGLGKIKQEAEKLGYLYYISPGSSLVKRMVKKHHPKAVLGVGCVMEVKEGTGMLQARGIPVQGVSLTHDGCVDTRVNVKELLERMYAGSSTPLSPEELDAKSNEISAMWKERVVTEDQKQEAKEQYLEPEKDKLGKDDVVIEHTGLYEKK